MNLSVQSPRSGKTLPHFSPPRGIMETGLWSSRWSGASTMLDHDMRQCARRALRCHVLMIDLAEEGKDGPLTIPGECLDISDSGLYAIVPIGYGVVVGQQFTFQLTISERGPEPGACQVVSQRGRVIRTDLLMSSDGHRLGVGVRLVGPRSGVVAMPS